MMIAIVYLLLNQTKVVENLKTDQVDLTAISTVSQLAQKWDKAVGIDNAGNVTFKKNVTNNGNATFKQNVNVKGTSTLEDINARHIYARHLAIGENKGQNRKIWFDPDGSLRVLGNARINDKEVIKRDDQVKFGSTKAGLTNELIWHWSNDGINAYPETHKSMHSTGYKWKLI